MIFIKFNCYTGSGGRRAGKRKTNLLFVKVPDVGFVHVSKEIVDEGDAHAIAQPKKARLAKNFRSYFQSREDAKDRHRGHKG
jgi:hypothetical protein